ncbi:MAG: DUF2470 domain-containing protein [Pseudomonadota bacterium]
MSRPTIAELARTLVHFHYHGVISTLATDGQYPYGSVIDYLALPHGDVVVLLHERAEHYRYLKASPKASLLVNAHLAEHEALLIPRVTLLGEATPADDCSDVVKEYLSRHPDAEPYISLEGMHFFQLDVKGVRYIAGAGRAAWIEAPDYRAARPDPLGEEAPWITHDLNDRFSDELREIGRRAGGQTWATAARVVSVDRLGFDLVCTAGERRHAIRVSLPTPVTSRAQFDRAFKQLVVKAVARLS